MKQKVTLGSWININNIRAVVCQQSTDPNRVIAVYLDNRRRVIARDTIYSNGKWEFEYPDPDGKVADNMLMYREFVSILKAGRFQR